MSTDTKIYTAAEVASARIRNEEIDQTLATITQKAYEASKHGGNRVVCYGSDYDFLNEVAHLLRELGYTAEVFKESTFGHGVTVRWGNTNPTKENNK